MFCLREANMYDHMFLVRIDLKDEGYTVSNEIEMTAQEIAEHRNKIKCYITDKDKGAFIIEDIQSNRRIGMIMYSIINRDSVKPYTIFNELDRKLFQKDGRFMQVFQLWINRRYRRMGLATKLKLELEKAARFHKVNVIYTHTEEENHHVIELNQKLRYEEIRRGPIWDEVIRVSLIKRLVD